MRGRDGRPHAQRSGEAFFQCQSKPSASSKRGLQTMKSRDDFEDYFALQQKKLEAQMEKAVSTIFKGCVFYILGFVGSGDDSRYSLTKLIERNGGRATLMLTGSTTHVATKSLCHRRQELLEKAVTARRLVLIEPKYIRDCVDAGKLLDPAGFAPAGAGKLSRGGGIEAFFKPSTDENKQ